ncbi:hypothetical protein PR001_g12355 [Phytophthora rubi]|uniref:Integrase catalytic domain-containing protein n=1 Tax=Phytophthora rubi TaxID=129364 RepID=A0A6A3M6H7_9STRA|nr:hypothetical protein PR001_g12355 [Phytophthora rubi]
MTRRLHEFKMDDGASMSKHLDAFDELVVGLQTMGERAVRRGTTARGVVELEYELISSVIENAKDIALIEVKEKLLKEYERLGTKDTTTERAFKVNAGRFKGNGHKWNGPKKNAGDFRSKCFKCNQPGHIKLDWWLIDSGATAHMTPHRSDLLEYVALDTTMEVTIADGKKLSVAGRGTVRLLGLEQNRIKMVDVLHIPGVCCRAIALSKKVCKAFVLDCDRGEPRFVQYAGADSQWELWHARMEHPNKDALAKTQRATNGIPCVGQAFSTLCGGCMKGKQTVEAFPKCSKTKTPRVLEVVHTDVMGPMKSTSKGGTKYILTFVDDFSRYVVAYFLKKKSEVASKLKEFMRFYEKQSGEGLMCLRSDNGTEFANKDVARICTLNGIMHQRTVPYSPQQNGVAERMNRTVARLHIRLISR